MKSCSSDLGEIRQYAADDHPVGGSGGKITDALKQPFDVYHERYEEWFDINQAAYISELLALRPFIPAGGNGIEVGVGSGRFAAPLGISIGIDPSSSMLSYAIARGIKGVMGYCRKSAFC